MGRGGLGTGRGSTGFDGQNRRGTVATGNFLDDFYEFGTPLKFLDIEHDHFGFGVLMEIAQQVQFVHVGFVTNGDEFGKTEFLVRCEIQYRSAQGTALRNKRDVARLWHSARKAGIEPNVGSRIDYPKAVGADHAHPSLTAHFNDAALDRKSLATDFLEARRDDDHRLDAFFNGLFDGSLRQMRGQNDNGQFDIIRDFLNILIGPDTGDRLGFGIYRVQGTRIAAFKDIYKNIMTNFSRRTGSSYHRHG